MAELQVVIMAGGVGSRLWPVSTPETPKQFIDLLGTGKTMIQMTMDRFAPVCKKENFWVVTGEQYAGTVHEQLPDIPEEQILAEPVARNTAPCIAYACRRIAAKAPGAPVVVTPADALVLEKEKFVRIIDMAVAQVRDTGRIVTIGIAPTRPETGYGYICAESVLQEEPVKVSAFREKPDLETAEDYLAAGNYFWNAGIFVWNERTVNEAIRRHAPEIASVMDRMEPFFGTPGEQQALREFFPLCPKISIDYAVMEKSDDIWTISGDLGWSDLGTWGSIRSHIPADSQGNSSVGPDVRLFDCKDCVVHASGAERVVVQGLEGYIVALSGGKLLVCSLADEQHIREYSQNQH